MRGLTLTPIYPLGGKQIGGLDRLHNVDSIPYTRGMSNYDAWLEAPYQRRYAEDDAYADFCDREGLDPESSEAESAWEDYKEAMSEPDPDLAYDQWREDRYLDYDYD